MTYTWYFIFNSVEFQALGLVSKNYSLILQGLGAREVLVTQGNYFGITYEDVFLPLNLNDKNPFEFEDLAVYEDADNNVWLGIAVED